MRATQECIQHDLRVLADEGGNQQPSPWRQQAHAFLMSRQLEAQTAIEELNLTLSGFV